MSLETLQTRTLLLEALTVATCPAEAETAIGSWVLRSSKSNVMRANTVTVFSNDQLDDAALCQRLEMCKSWYANHGKAVHFRISSHPAAMAVDKALAALNYVQYHATVVLQIVDLPKTDLSAFATSWQTEAIDVGTATQWRMTTRGEALDVAAREASAAQEYSRNLPRGDVQIWLDGIIEANGILGIAAAAPLRRKTYACAVVDAQQNIVAAGVARLCGGHVGLFNVYTVAEHRGQGCGQAITQALLAWGQNQGASAAFLQVEADNKGAIRIYERFGFAVAYGYHYRQQA